MGAYYNIQDALNWDNSDKIVIQPKGWKQVTISYIDATPHVFWRINEIQNDFRSLGVDVIKKGPERFFSDSLESLKLVIDTSLEIMSEERKEFYIKNIIGLFDE